MSGIYGDHFKPQCQTFFGYISLPSQCYMEHGAPGHHGQVVANLVDLDQENELEAAITPLQKMVAKSALENKF